MRIEAQITIDVDDVAGPLGPEDREDLGDFLHDAAKEIMHSQAGFPIEDVTVNVAIES